MNDPTGPRRIEVADLERRVLDAARREAPSRAMSERMAGALGISSAALGATTLGTAATTLQESAKGALEASGSAGAGVSVWAPWVLGLTVVAAVGAGVAVTSRPEEPREHTRPPSSPVPVESPAELRAPLEPTDPAPRHLTIEDLPRSVEAPRESRIPARRATDLGDEIAVIDAARSAVRAGQGNRALDLVSQYVKRHPRGTFRPEAQALKIEALVQVGRTSEARALAERFVATRRGTPLGDRVARVVGLDEP